MTDLPAGRELDALVHAVLGRNDIVPKPGDYFRQWVASWNYSTNTADAIEAMEAWCNLGGGVGNRFSIDRNFGRGYTVSVYTRDNVVYASAPTLAHAAALALVATTQKESV